MDSGVMLIAFVVFTVYIQCVSSTFSEKTCLYINDLISSCISKQGNVCISNNHYFVDMIYPLFKVQGFMKLSIHLYQLM